jgi:hypothetical protein
MTSKLKQTVASLLVVTAMAVLCLAGSYIYLNYRLPTDTSYIDTHLEQVTTNQGYHLAEARKAGVPDEEIRVHLVKKNKAEFDTKWLRILLIVGSLYIATSLSVIALSLTRQARC